MESSLCPDTPNKSPSPASPQRWPPMMNAEGGPGRKKVLTSAKSLLCASLMLEAWPIGSQLILATACEAALMVPHFAVKEAEAQIG